MPRRSRQRFMLQQTWLYVLSQQHELMLATRTHLALSLSSLVVAAAVGIPLGIWTSRHAAGRSVVSVVTALRVIPSLAVLALVLPFEGIGFKPALTAL
ncbi:MAG: ABC transporter permease, partial [Candidatus Eremiobacteraeota bacterium]|nr:ABC transporter permease [Candidatus Eremiobacteraeota bacterium]